MHIVAMQHLNELKHYALHNDNCKIMLLCTEIEAEVQNNQLNKQNRQTSILDFFNKKIMYYMYMYSTVPVYDI